MLPGKTYDQILTDMLADMVKMTPFTYTEEGSIARSFFEVVAYQIGDLYSQLEEDVANCRISTATGSYLDEIGQIVGCTRGTGEGDENYRYRIANQVYTAAKSNKTALDILCRQVDGVKDLIWMPYSNGVGSFSVYVITDEIDTPNAVVNAVQNIIEQNQALGISGYAKKPTLIPVDLKMQAVFPNNTPDSLRVQTCDTIATAIASYINYLPMGASLSIQDIRQSMKASYNIMDIIPQGIIIADIAREVTDMYAIKLDERLYARNINVTK